MKLRQIHESQQKIEIASNILNKLPGWFGIPEATDEYIRHSSNMPFFAAYLASETVGFIAIKENNRYTGEIYVMGVDPHYHGKGIGKSLVTGVKDWCREHGYEFLQVKTLGESHPDVNYDRTRRFYQSIGFRPLECFPELWGKDNPCLVMIMYIGS